MTIEEMTYLELSQKLMLKAEAGEHIDLQDVYVYNRLAAKLFPPEKQEE